MLYWIYFRNTARLLKLRYRRRERSALFLFDEVSYNARYMKIRGVKKCLFSGFWAFQAPASSFRQFSLLGVHLRVVVFYTCFMRLFLSGFIFSGCCLCLLLILILQLNQRAFHRLAVAFRWNAFRLFNTSIKYLYLNFNAAIIYSLLRTHDCRIWVCCSGNRLFFKPSW